MSDISSIVVLYSKYSSNSKKLLDIIREFSLPQFLTIPFREYCIDNKQVRKMVIDSSKLSVSFVPVILIFFKNGYIEKYEGEKSFQWTSEIINSLNLNIPKEERIEYEEGEIESEIEEEPPGKRKNSSRSEFKGNSRSASKIEPKVDSRVESRARVDSKSERVQSREKQGKTEITTLLSLDSDLEDEFQDELENEEPTRNEAVEKSIKKDTGIMARAMEIQKLRDEVQIES